jgi:quinolinate synthase
MSDEIVKRINELKKKRNAVIMRQNYQPAEVQDIADFTGDSLDLSRKAAETKADVIIFCGVHFMAETAAMIAPGKTVILSEMAAGCPMADMVDVKKLRALKQKHPGVPVVCYVNTSAAVKAESDVCCTSSNAVKVVNSLKQDSAIFVPDRNLGAYTASKTGKKLIFTEGYCIVHERITIDDVLEAKKQHPGAEVLVHPECRPEVAALADKVLSTSGMCEYAKQSKCREIIIGTEIGIIHRLKKENPDKRFYPVSERAVCVNMKKNNLEKVLWALEDMKNVIKVDKDTTEKSKQAIDRMLEVK